MRDQYTMKEKVDKLDAFGGALFVPAIVMIMLALQWGGEEYSWDSPTIVGLICGFVGLSAGFFIWEYHRGDNAMIPYSLLLDRSIICSCLFSCLSFGAMLSSVFYLPEWFQVIKKATAIHSGVMQLPSILSQTLAAGISSFLTTRIGYCNPFLFIGMTFLSISAGLYTTLTPSTSHACWISYQVLAGLGQGCAIQMPILAVQAALDSRPQQIATGMSVLFFFNYFGGSMFLSIALTVFRDGLTSALKQKAGLDNEQVDVLLFAGSGHARQVTEQMFPEKMALVLAAYNTAITRVFFIAVAASITAFMLASGIKWKNIKGKKLIPIGNEAETGVLPKKTPEHEASSTRGGVAERPEKASTSERT